MVTRTTARIIAVNYIYELLVSNETAENILNEQLTEENFQNIVNDNDLAEDADFVNLYAKFPDKKQIEYIKQVVTGVSEHSAELDSYIEKYAIGWRFNRLPKTAIAIMRVAIYEMLYVPEIPNKASINEAVNIAKKYEDSKMVAFVNGVLGTFSRNELEKSSNVEQSGEQL